MSRSAVLLLLLLMASGHGTAVEPLRQRLEQANAALARAWLAEDTAALRTRYRDGALLMPEHATTWPGGDAIAGYRRLPPQWLDGSATLACARRIHDVVDFGAYAVETGTFRHELRAHAAGADRAGAPGPARTLAAAVHNGTFDLAMHAWDDPFEQVSALAGERGIPLATPRMGERVDLAAPQPTAPWWRE